MLMLYILEESASTLQYHYDHSSFIRALEVTNIPSVQVCLHVYMFSSSEYLGQYLFTLPNQSATSLVNSHSNFLS